MSLWFFCLRCVNDSSVCLIFDLFVRKYLQVRTNLRVPFIFLVSRCLLTNIVEHLLLLFQTVSQAPSIQLLFLVSSRLYTTTFELLILFFQLTFFIVLPQFVSCCLLTNIAAHLQLLFQTVSQASSTEFILVAFNWLYEIMSYYCFYLIF